MISNSRNFDLLFWCLSLVNWTNTLDFLGDKIGRNTKPLSALVCSNEYSIGCFMLFNFIVFLPVNEFFLLISWCAVTESHQIETDTQFYIHHLIRKLGCEPYSGQRAIPSFSKNFHGSRKSAILGIWIHLIRGFSKLAWVPVHHVSTVVRFTIMIINSILTLISFSELFHNRSPLTWAWKQHIIMRS